MKHKLSLFAVLMMALAIPQSVKAYDFSKAYQGQMLYYTVIDSVNHYVMLTCSKDSILPNDWWGTWNGFGDNPIDFDGWDNSNRPSGALVLPDTVSHDGITYTVRAIGEAAFYRCPIFSVTMPNTVDSIGDYAFGKCSYLSNVTFSNTLHHIGNRSFSNTNLGNVVLPSPVRFIGANAFSEAHITSITLSDSLQTMETACLADNLFTSIYIPASVREIPMHSSSPVMHMGNILTSIVVDPNNPHFDSRENCNAIINSATDELLVGCMNTVIPTDIYAIHFRAFSGCSFETLVLPTSVHYFNFDNCWSGCHASKLVVSSSTIIMYICGPAVDTIQVLNDVPPFLGISDYNGFWFDRPIVVVPCNSISAYQATDGWSNFTNYIEDGMQKVTAIQTEHGNVMVVRPTCANPSATFTATADEGYHFLLWNDGNTDNPRIVPIVSDTTLTATFAINQYTVTAIPNDTEMGDVIGSGMCDHGSTITLTATANSSYHFDHWSDNITENPRPLTVTRDTTVTAFFVALPVDTLYIHDTTIITDTVVFRYYMYDTTIVNNYQYDTSIYNHFQFDTTLVFDTIIINIYNFDTSIYNTYQYDTTIVNYYYYDTVYINSYTHDTVNNYFYDTINNYYYDTVIITHTYHDTVFVNNYIFDTIYLNRYIFDTIYIHDTVFVPSGQEGIGGVDAINAKIFQRDGQIIVDGAEGNQVWLYDINGRVLATRQDDYSSIHFDVPASGTYMIKIGNHPARKVVVIR